MFDMIIVTLETLQTVSVHVPVIRNGKPVYLPIKIQATYGTSYGWNNTTVSFVKDGETIKIGGKGCADFDFFGTHLQVGVSEEEDGFNYTVMIV